MSTQTLNRRKYAAWLASTLVLLAAGVPTPAATQSAIVVTIPADLLARAGIATTPAARGSSASGVHIPATVQPNAYRQVIVSSTSAGRVMTVPAELGARVRRGDPLVTLHSPEVAEAERAAVGLQADLTLVRQTLTRLDRLVTIGAASRQELDEATAQQTRVAADLESAHARLVLLGRTPAQVQALTSPAAISPVVTLLAPIAGTITARAANVGQTLDASTALLTIVDLDTVWIVGDVFERDIAAVRVGSDVTMTSAASPGAFAGRVTYIDPQVSVDTRTARVRVEVANPGGRLRLGMLVDMRVNTSRAAVTVPRSAVQTIDSVDVVYVADAKRAGTFLERSVRLGSSAGDQVEVLAGLTAGEPVVTSGSFFVRSERDRVSTTPPHPAPSVSPVVVRAPPARAAGPIAPAESREILVTDEGFTPAVTHIPAGVAVRLRFIRKVQDTCVTEVVFTSLKIRRELPLNTVVVIDLPPQPAGRLDFACGMNMVKGQIIVDEGRNATR